MRMIRPKLDALQVTIAEDQEEYKPVTAALVDHPLYTIRDTDYNTVVLAFRPTADELGQLNDGAEIYVSLLTFGGPMQPIICTVGAQQTADIYGIPVEAPHV
jgi:hypothetical protein